MIYVPHVLELLLRRYLHDICPSCTGASVGTYMIYVPHVLELLLRKYLHDICPSCTGASVEEVLT